MRQNKKVITPMKQKNSAAEEKFPSKTPETISCLEALAQKGTLISV